MASTSCHGYYTTHLTRRQPLLASFRHLVHPPAPALHPTHTHSLTDHLAGVDWTCWTRWTGLWHAPKVARVRAPSHRVQARINPTKLHFGTPGLFSSVQVSVSQTPRSLQSLPLSPARRWVLGSYPQLALAAPTLTPPLNNVPSIPSSLATVPFLFFLFSSPHRALRLLTLFVFFLCLQ